MTGKTVTVSMSVGCLREHRDSLVALTEWARGFRAAQQKDEPDTWGPPDPDALRGLISSLNYALREDEER